MHRASSIVRRADMIGKIAVDTITLDRAARWRRRIALRTDRGHDVLLDLTEATYLTHGDGLLLDNGGYVTVVAAKEPLIEIHTHTQVQLARIAWHIGNRHTPCEIAANALYIQPDHVLEEMATGLGGHVHRIMRVFEPEGGAYGHKGALLESHHRESGQSNADQPDHAHSHATAHQHDH